MPADDQAWMLIPPDASKRPFFSSDEHAAIYEVAGPRAHNIEIVNGTISSAVFLEFPVSVV